MHNSGASAAWYTLHGTVWLLRTNIDNRYYETVDRLKVIDTAVVKVNYNRAHEVNTKVAEIVKY
ncbi:MAG: hypothetical protein ACP5JH_07315 [Bacteroidota bacterium]